MMDKDKNITNSAKLILKDFWNDFASKYLIDIIIAFFLLILVAATASVYPYLIQQVLIKIFLRLVLSGRTLPPHE